MHFRRTVKLLLILQLLNGCSWFQPTANFIISNGSEDREIIDIKVSIGAENVFNDSIRYSNIEPDLQYTPYVTLPKGLYTIKVIADSGKVIVEQPINLDNDRWIFVSYGYKQPLDTIELGPFMKMVGNDTSWVNTQRRGFPPRVTIHIMEKEPIHM